MGIEDLSRDQAYCALSELTAVGPISLNRLLDRFDGDPTRILSAGSSELGGLGLRKKAIDSLLQWNRLVDLPKIESQLARTGTSFISRENDRYPDLLREIYDPPIGLYCMGDYDFSRPNVAIVGSRKTTLYGRTVAESFGKELAQRGICVVSGLARGIDTFAHRGALNADEGKTVAVLGNGLDIVYPPENVDLYRMIGDGRGAVLSEFPFGRRADKQTFPMRNRVVSGMSVAVIVVESDETGGSLITAKFAGDQGRVVCAVPGRIDQKTSRGCHQLIRDGALLLTSIDDLLEEIEYASKVPIAVSSNESASEIDLDGDERQVLEEFRGGEALTIDGLSEALALSSPQVAATVMMLEIKGCVEKRMDGAYEATVVFH